MCRLARLVRREFVVQCRNDESAATLKRLFCKTYEHLSKVRRLSEDQNLPTAHFEMLVTSDIRFERNPSQHSSSSQLELQTRNYEPGGSAAPNAACFQSR